MLDFKTALGICSTQCCNTALLTNSMIWSSITQTTPCPKPCHRFCGRTRYFSAFFSNKWRKGNRINWENLTGKLSNSCEDVGGRNCFGEVWHQKRDLQPHGFSRAELYPCWCSPFTLQHHVWFLGVFRLKPRSKMETTRVSSSCQTFSPTLEGSFLGF